MNNTAWAAPLVQNLNYSKNCTSFGRFIFELTSDGETSLGRFWNDTGSDLHLSWAEVRTNTVLNMIRGALSVDYSDSLPGPTPEQLMLWFLENSDNITSVENLGYHASVCRVVICPSIGFRGAGEVIGPGVLSSAMIECLMVLVYAIATVAFTWRTGPYGGGQSPAITILDRFILAFRGTITDFKRTAAVLGLTMVIATSFVIARKLSNSTLESAPLEIPLAALMSISSICAVFALSVLQTNWTTGHRRSGLSSAICAVLLAFGSGVILAGHIAQGGLCGLELTPLQSLTATLCVQTRYREMVYGIVISLVYSCSFFPMAVVAVWLLSWASERLVLAFGVQTLKTCMSTKLCVVDGNGDAEMDNKPLPLFLVVRDRVVNMLVKLVLRMAGLRKQTTVKLLALFVAFSMMCFTAVTALLLKLRLQFSRDSFEWTFGQVPAIGTWIPIILEWCYVFLCELPDLPIYTYSTGREYTDHATSPLVGMEKGLEGRIPREYVTVHLGRVGGQDIEKNIDRRRRNSF